MTDPADDFDAVLARRFALEHTHVPADPFVAVTLRRIRTMQRRAAGIRIGMQITALAVVISASPWLIAGAARLNAALTSSSSWTAGLPGTWVLGAVALVALLGSRVFRRR